jgi:structural maintenance of chromosome 3 (chondroitin sulfate proteoglycan 6)
MKSSETSFKSELGTDLLSQLSVEDQREIDSLNDEITNLSTGAKEALKERSRVSSQVLTGHGQ